MKFVIGLVNCFLVLIEGGDVYFLVYNFDLEMIKVFNEEEVWLVGVGLDFVIVVIEGNIYV